MADNISSTTSPGSGNNRTLYSYSTKMVTPDRLSTLLLNHGPLAIRHINQALSKEVPDFENLSPSKQRRLIMSALEDGDRENSVVFEKVGWGQWSARRVPAEDFDKELAATNIKNAKVKDTSSQQDTPQQRRNSEKQVTKPKVRSKSSVAAAKPSVGFESIEPLRINSNGSQIMYIHENAIVSEEDEEEENEVQNMDDLRGPHAPRRRQSSIVYVDSELDNELLAQKMRSVMKGKSRRQSSVNRLQHPAKHAAITSVHLDIPTVPATTTVYPPIAERQQGSFSDPSSRRESRASISKESSIRSTLLPDKPASNAPLKATTDHSSDTDEEDWRSIGAESLRNNNSPKTTTSEKTAARLLLSLKSET